MTAQIRLRGRRPSGRSAGLDSPTIIEMKSQPGPVGAAVIQVLHGVIFTNRAQQRLLVAMGGIKAQASTEFRSLRTPVQNGDAETLLNHLFETNQRLRETTRRALPPVQALLDDERET